MPSERLNFTALRAESDGQMALDRAAQALFSLFLVREREFGFNPAIATEYPEIEPAATSAFLGDPILYVDTRIKALSKPGETIDRVVILTTFADRIGDALGSHGFVEAIIDMPAGPEFTAAYTRGPDEGRTLYLEAVNEADERIRPSFALELRNAEGQLRGGACGSVHERDGTRYAYLATMTLGEATGPAAGSQLAERLLTFLHDEGVSVIHLGTQTAGPFYEKLGFRVTRTVLKRLRRRKDRQGREIYSDLVMMEKRLP